MLVLIKPGRSRHAWAHVGVLLFFAAKSAFHTGREAAHRYHQEALSGIEVGVDPKEQRTNTKDYALADFIVSPTPAPDATKLQQSENAPGAPEEFATEVVPTGATVDQNQKSDADETLHAAAHVAEILPPHPKACRAAVTKYRKDYPSVHVGNIMKYFMKK